MGEALIFPTHSDTWGFVVNEAMACGLPVVATEVAGCVPDLIEDGWNGKVVPVGDPVKLGSAMKYPGNAPGTEFRDGQAQPTTNRRLFARSMRSGHRPGGDDMRSGDWESFPHVKVAFWAGAVSTRTVGVRSNLSDFRNASYLTGLIVMQVVLTSLWHFETVFFPLLIGFFLWAGTSSPFTAVGSQLGGSFSRWRPFSQDS